jgi:dTDP-4-amino-4,6-dideoxygalactose transaminase
MSVSKIPFLDLTTVHHELQQELTLVFRNAMDTAAFVGGAVVESFEEKFAQFCDAPYSVGVSSGTDALRFALLAAGIGKDEIVVTVANTFIATTEAISQAGAAPEFVDVDERTYNMDPEKLQEFLEVRCTPDPLSGKLISNSSGRPVTCVVPVHLYGQMADMDPIRELADRYRLLVVEDACQAHGARYYSKKENRWFKAGSMGVAAAFSFYPGKNLGACGEAGAITTKDPEIARKVRMLRDHGQSEKYYHDVEGYNGRLDAIQAGILSVKLAHLESWNAARVEAARRYYELFSAAGASVVLPFQPDCSQPVYHLYVIQAENREAMRQELGAAGIGSAIHYPVPLHLQKAYAGMRMRPGNLPVTEAAARRILSLPMFPNISPASQQRIVEVVSTLSQRQETSPCMVQ